jgi:hypothetical protein
VGGLWVEGRPTRHWSGPHARWGGAKRARRRAAPDVGKGERSCVGVVGGQEQCLVDVGLGYLAIGVELVRKPGYRARTATSRGTSPLWSSCWDGRFRSHMSYGLFLHSNEGSEGAERAVESITIGLGWSKAAEYVVVSGKTGKSELEACWNLGATVAAQLMV